MTAETSQEDRKIKRFIKQVESDLVDLGKVMNTRLYNLSTIKRRLAKSAEPGDLVAKKVNQIEESIKTLASVFDIKYILRDLKPFFTMLRRTITPPRQTLITDWFKEFTVR